MLKKCSKCKKEKLTNNFNKNRSKKDGFSTECKNCCKLYHQQRIKKYPITPIGNTKKCCICNLEKEYKEFNKDITHKDGFRSNCRLCQNNIIVAIENLF